MDTRIWIQCFFHR